MADSLVSSTVTFALENLSRLLADEVKLLLGVEDEMSSLRDQLKILHAFLRDFEGKGNSGVVEEVVSQIRDVTHKTEDVIDTYIVNVDNHRRRNMLGKIVHFKEHVSMLHEVDDQIKKIKVKIDEIYKNKATFGIEEGDFKSRDRHNTMEQDAESLRRRRRDVEEEDVVHDSTVVIEKLKEQNSRLTVISIIGMGGLGKTTLARKIYNNDVVKGMFPCRAWGYVSNDYRAKEFLLSLLQCLNLFTSEYKDLNEDQLKEKVKDLNEDQLKEKVRKCLGGRKYLVVLDDMWKTEVWDELKGAFPNDKNGSRILITSRMKDVASYSKSILSYHLPFLSKEDSWHMFCKKVFGDEEFPGDLESLGRRMVESCKGLPLAIIVLAGLVAKKDKSHREWMRIRNGINWQLGQDKIVMDILKLSYDNLPRELKPCFLYMGIYPEDYEIGARRLIELWIAEGFIQPKEIGTSTLPEPEDVADYYLDELVDRSLVQVASKRLDGGIKTCRIHDLLRDLCILESKTNKFMEVGTESDINKCNSRRLSLHCKIELLPTKCCQSHPRSLFLFADRVGWDSDSKGWEWIRVNLELVRVLDLDKVSCTSTPHGLQTLIHLRYLRVSVRSSTIENNTLTSLCNLWNLETLHLSASHGGYLVTIPSGMWMLKRLRHVNVGGEAWVKPPACMVRGENVETAVSLQTVGYVVVSPELVNMMNNDFFPNLTKLGLAYLMFWPQQFSGLHHLNKLRKLKITGFQLNRALDGNMLPPNLTKITLVHLYGLDSRFMNTWGHLGSLQVLKLKVGVILGSINCAAGEFPQLEVFHMNDIRIKGQWRQEKGAMPHLRRLILHHCDYWDEQEQRYLSLRNLL